MAQAFFDTYARALLARDPQAVADMYAVPALIEFPEQALAVSSSAQTEEFFTAAFGQYDEITQVDAGVNVIAETGHSVWADVTWTYDGSPAERFMYQLVRAGGQWQIAVLTPLNS